MTDKEAYEAIAARVGELIELTEVQTELLKIADRSGKNAAVRTDETFGR